MKILKYIGVVFSILAILILIVGIYTIYIIWQTNLLIRITTSFTTYLLNNFSLFFFPYGLLTTVFFIIGLAGLVVDNSPKPVQQQIIYHIQTNTPPPPPPPLETCSSCGSQNEEDSVYCKKCGKQIK